MENKERLRPMLPMEKDFATEHYHLIMDFLKHKKLNPEDFFDVVVFDYLLSVEIYLGNPELQQKCKFEAVSYMYMKRAIYRHFRKEQAQKRSSENGTDICFEEIDAYIGKSSTMENFSLLEYAETIKQIMENLSEEQRKIFFDKLEGYTLKEIAETNNIKEKRVYKQFGKIKCIVADLMQ